MEHPADAGFLVVAQDGIEPAEIRRRKLAALLAVERCGAAAPSGKALIIYRKSRFDAPGTVLIFR